MTNPRSIVISGDIGSGKSTISLQLASRLGLRRVSVGNLYRDMAGARGMSALQLNLHAERDEAVDDQVDQMQAEMARSGEQLVVDSRLAWHFFPEAFKVHLIADPGVAARRVMSRPESDVEAYPCMADAVAGLQRRSDSERTRFLLKYGVDKARLRNYDLVCDTTHAQPGNITDSILAAAGGTLSASMHVHPPPLLLLNPRRVYPGPGVRHLRDLRESGPAEDLQQPGGADPEPVSAAYTGRYFYLVDGHRRLSAAVASGRTLLPARLVAEAGEQMAAGLSAQQYFEAMVSLSMICDWAAAHGIELGVPPHLARGR